MGQKLWKKASQKQLLHYTYDYSVHGGAVGTISLGDLPSGFVATAMYADAETALVGGGSLVVGEDGGGDDDGYFADLDAIAVGTTVKGGGALITDGVHKVAAAKDGFQVTIATTAYTAGKVHFTVEGYQAQA
jgi:hypothetical protein